MKQKKFVGVIVLGVFFILFSIFCFASAYGVAYRLETESIINKLNVIVESTLSSLGDSDRQESQEELVALGNLEAFSKARSMFTTELKWFAKDYANTFPSNKSMVAFIQALVGVLFFLSGILLIVHFTWARICAFVTMSIAVFGYVFIWATLYPVFHMLTIMTNFIDHVNLFFSKSNVSATMTGGGSTLGQIISWPYIVLHISVIFTVSGVVFYLTRPAVAERL